MQGRESLLVAETSWGPIRIHLQGGRVVACHLPPAGNRQPHPPVLRKFHGTIQKTDAQAARRVESFLRALWAGRRAPGPALQIPVAGPFVMEAWRQLARVPLGTTISYAELAARAGRPRAARAAGTACATNLIPLFIPCHRVLASGGKLGGFSGGLAWKRALLSLEHVAGDVR